jgi:hypothetical protein
MQKRGGSSASFLHFRLMVAVRYTAGDHAD